MTPAQQAAFKTTIESGHLPSETVWFTNDLLLKRIQMDRTLPILGTGAPDTENMTMGFSSYGAPCTSPRLPAAT